jgi:MFS family permease
VADINGNVPPEWMINIDALSIIILMIFIGYITGHFKPIVMMIVGMLISLFGLIFTGTNTTGWIVLLGIFIFAIGEMTCSPKFSEYIGLMAPPEKKAIYLGYSNIPFAIGWFFALLFSGVFYGNYADKYDFGRQYIAQDLGLKEIYVQYVSVQESSELEGTYALGMVSSEIDTNMIVNPEARIPRGEIKKIWIEKETVMRDRALEKEYHAQGKALKKQGKLEEAQKLLSKETGLKRIAVMPVLTYKLSLNNRQITAMLWDKYHPWKMWIYFGFIGAGAIILMIGYHFYLETDLKKRGKVS